MHPAAAAARVAAGLHCVPCPRSAVPSLAASARAGCCLAGTPRSSRVLSGGHEPGPPRTTFEGESPMNSVALIGRLTADPATHAGEKHESATFRLAVPRPGSD